MRQIAKLFRSFVFLMVLTMGMGVVSGVFTNAAHAGSSWRMAHKMPPDSPEGKVFQRFANLVKKYSSDSLAIKMFPNVQLGKTNAVMEQLKLGTVPMCGEGSTYKKKWIPENTRISAGFQFEAREEWVRV